MKVRHVNPEAVLDGIGHLLLAFVSEDVDEDVAQRLRQLHAQVSSGNDSETV